MPFLQNGFCYLNLFMGVYIVWTKKWQNVLFNVILLAFFFFWFSWCTLFFNNHYQDKVICVRSPWAIAGCDFFRYSNYNKCVVGVAYHKPHQIAMKKVHVITFMWWRAIKVSVTLHDTAMVHINERYKSAP